MLITITKLNKNIEPKFKNNVIDEIRFVCKILKLQGQNKTPEDGFEPPLEEPESSVLPLDDSGIIS